MKQNLGFAFISYPSTFRGPPACSIPSPGSGRRPWSSFWPRAWVRFHAHQRIALAQNLL